MTPDEPEDAELVVLAQRGEIAALATLFQRHRASLYAVAVAMLRDRDEAADAVQDTFVTALTRITSVNDPVAIRGWLRAVVRNACRMRMRHREPIPLERLPDVADPDPDPEQLVASRQARDWIWSGLSALGAEDRLTLVLRHFSRCTSYQAIAMVTGVPVGTVRSRLHRAHRQLAEVLERMDGDSSHDQHRLESERRAAWEHFYEVVLQVPEPSTYRSLYNRDVQVRECGAAWTGIEDWVAEERPAIELGVRAAVVGVIAATDLTVLEIDFSNPSEAPDHCPPRTTFVHRLDRGRTKALAIHHLQTTTNS